MQAALGMWLLLECSPDVQRPDVDPRAGAGVGWA